MKKRRPIAIIWYQISIPQAFVVVVVVFVFVVVFFFKFMGVATTPLG